MRGLVVVVAVAACAPSSESTPDACGPGCYDHYVGSAVRETTRFLYNQNFAGQPGGAADKMVNCALAGTVHITGTTSYDTGTMIETVHLVYAFTGCHHTDPPIDITLNGTLSEDGTFNTSGGTETFASTSMMVAGTYSSYPLDGTCPLNMAMSGRVLSGSWCGRIWP